MKPSVPLPLLFALLAAPAAFAEPVAFPGAEGFGRFASGGRGGAVHIVTNLNDSGPGSLRAAVTASGPRTVVFEVSGTIELASNLRITQGDLTIAGQTAPGDGICLAHYTLDPSGSNNVIIRFLRSRMGNLSGEAADAFSCRYADRVIVDHCSFSWSVDEAASAYDNTNFTMQWCIVSESLRDAGHPKGLHGYGGIWGGRGASFHHNLIAHHDSRNPRLNGARFHGTDEELVDFRNNLIFNWRSNSCYGGEPTDAGIPSRQNLVNNYYQPGPATASHVRARILNPSPNAGNYGLFHVEGNVTEGNATVTTDNWNGGVQGPDASQLAAMRAASAFEVEPVATQTAGDARLLVLAHAGCARPARDSVDARIVSEAETGTATYSGGVHGYPGILDTQNDVGGWPALVSTPPPADTDRDGMPDSWETARGLDPADPADRNLVDAKGYTQLENYLNHLAAEAFPLPEITIQPEPSTVNLGDPAMLAVSATGEGTLSYQWFRGGDLLPSETAATLTISSATFADAGDYRVEVSDVYGTMQSEPAAVTVLGDSPPIITLEPTDETAPVGGTATFTAAAVGPPELTYQWFTGSGNEVPGATDATLTLSPIDPAHAGTYYVEVSNGFGAVASAKTRLSVQSGDLTTTLLDDDFQQDTLHTTTPNASSLHWFVMSSKNATTSSVGDDPATADIVETRPLTLTMSLTSSGVVEAAAVFAPAPVQLGSPDEKLRARITFVPTNVRCIGINLANSGGSTPLTGLIDSGLASSKSDFATGGTQTWLGYRFAAYAGADTLQIDARPVQPGTNNASQALVVSGTSSSFPDAIAATTDTVSPTDLMLTDGTRYLWTSEIERLVDDRFLLTGTLHDAANPDGTPLFQSSSITENAAARPSSVTEAFDSIAIGYRNLDNSSVSSLQVEHLRIEHEHEITLSDPYSAFAFLHGLGSDGFVEDTDGDGLANGLEFILGGDPTDRSDIPSPVMETNGSLPPVATFVHHVEAAQVADLAVEESDDLTIWTPVAPARIAPGERSGDCLPVVVSFPDTASRWFLRLSATPLTP